MRSERATLVWTLIITGLAGFMASLDNLVVTTALPSIRTDLGGGLEDLEWTVSAYTLTFAVLLLFGSALGDRFGRRRVFGAGVALFTAASAAAALAPGIESLIAARAVQGVGAAVMMPLTLTLLTVATPPNRRGLVFGIWGAINGLAVFVAWEMRTPHPMLPMHLFRSRAFSAMNAASLLMFAGMFGSIFLLSQFLQTVLGHSPTEAGLRMLPWTAMPLLVAPIAGAVSDRVGGRPVVAAGLALQALGLAMFALVASPDVSYAAQLPSLVVSGIGMGMFFAPAAGVVMASVRPAEQGMASGANNALRELGGAVGVASLAAVFAERGGYTTGQTFTDGLVPALWLGAALVALGAAAAFTLPRRHPTPTPTQEELTAAA
ncbi:MFS transporter [Actinocorallia sp. API 0066]|uniref:MFS transporter n=1 Tax=Actinocorallia sp. API 0066 TaxID=2896846 RepID=UPI001E5C1CDE|nr:MFS transporter [Actinocorallia sp. API 0066]MCD0453087.1 MFS transporter [Actinocorallia sp. API 0066]